MEKTLHHILYIDSCITDFIIFKFYLGESLDDAGIDYSSKKNFLNSLKYDGYEDSFLFIELTDKYYKDFILTNNSDCLYIIFKDNLTPFWLEINEINERFIVENPLNKFHIIYSARDTNRLHFNFSFLMSEYEEKNAWNKMIDFIEIYESNNESAVSLVSEIKAQKDNTRFFNYHISEAKWNILNPLMDITLSNSQAYYSALNDTRIKKPKIYISEENYGHRHIWPKRQWILYMEELQIIISQPNDISLYLSLADKSLAISKEFFDKEFNSRKGTYYNSLLRNEETKKFYDYFESVISAIIFSFTSIEAFANICIVNGYVYNRKEKKGSTKQYSKEEILSTNRISLSEKLKNILPEILLTPDPTKEKWWLTFIGLQDIRNNIIHTKQSKSEDRYSEFLSKDIFNKIEVSKEIIKYFGQYIDKNAKSLLIDYPYCFGYNNVLPYFIKEEDYMRTARRMRGIPDDKK